jgi:hypothetical protein
LKVSDKNDVALTVPDKVDGLVETHFKGSQTSQLKECMLIIDHATGEITIERLGS